MRFNNGNTWKNHIILIEKMINYKKKKRIERLDSDK
jgi:hypothetical protein